MGRTCGKGVHAAGSCPHSGLARSHLRSHRRQRAGVLHSHANGNAASVAAGKTARGGTQGGSAVKQQDKRLRGFPAPLDKEIFRMAIPSFATIVMDPLLGMTDTMIMGRIGGEALAGVGLGSVVCGGFNWIFGFLSVLTVPKVAAAMAKRDKAAATEHIGQALWVAVLVGCTTMGVVLMFGPQLLQGAPAAASHERLGRLAL